jgi:hypothetical protein
MSVRLDDPLVAPRHLTVTPTGAGWTIRSQDPLGTCQVIDQAGRLVGLRGEMTIATGQLIVGTTLILLSPIPQA